MLDSLTLFLMFFTFLQANIQHEKREKKTEATELSSDEKLIAELEVLTSSKNWKKNKKNIRQKLEQALKEAKTRYIELNFNQAIAILKRCISICGRIELDFFSRMLQAMIKEIEASKLSKTIAAAKSWEAASKLNVEAREIFAKLPSSEQNAAENLPLKRKIDKAVIVDSGNANQLYGDFSSTEAFAQKDLKKKKALLEFSLKKYNLAASDFQRADQSKESVEIRTKSKNIEGLLCETKALQLWLNELQENSFRTDVFLDAMLLHKEASKLLVTTPASGELNKGYAELLKGLIQQTLGHKMRSEGSYVYASNLFDKAEEILKKAIEYLGDSKIILNGKKLVDVVKIFINECRAYSALGKVMEKWSPNQNSIEQKYLTLAEDWTRIAWLFEINKEANLEHKSNLDEAYATWSKGVTLLAKTVSVDNRNNPTEANLRTALKNFKEAQNLFKGLKGYKREVDENRSLVDFIEQKLKKPKVPLSVLLGTFIPVGVLVLGVPLGACYCCRSSEA